VVTCFCEEKNAVLWLFRPKIDTDPHNALYSLTVDFDGISSLKPNFLPLLIKLDDISHLLFAGSGGQKKNHRQTIMRHEQNRTEPSRQIMTAIAAPCDLQLTDGGPAVDVIRVMTGQRASRRRRRSIAGRSPIPRQRQAFVVASRRHVV